jgi:hypothetical protein
MRSDLPDDQEQSKQADPFEKITAINVLSRAQALGAPTLDGLGIDGDGAHAEWDRGLISWIEPRTLLMRGLLETLA